MVLPGASEKKFQPTRADRNYLKHGPIDFKRLKSGKTAHKLLWHVITSNVSKLAPEIVNDVLHQVYLCKEKFGVSEELIRMVLVLSLSQPSRDLRRNAIELANELLIDWVSKGSGLYDARRRKAITLRMIGEYDQSVQEYRALMQSKETESEEQLAECKNELAYVLAETGEQRFKKKALRFVGDSLTFCQHDPMFLDTKGYVLIKLGRTNEEIDQGLKICRDALNLWKPLKCKHLKSTSDVKLMRQLQKLYYDKHRLVAAQRLAR